MMAASVVLPQPGGPKKMQLVSVSVMMARRSGRPGPTMCAWPMNSSSVRGRMRSASGARFCAISENRSSKCLPPLRMHTHIRTRIIRL